MDIFENLFVGATLRLLMPSVLEIVTNESYNLIDADFLIVRFSGQLHVTFSRLISIIVRLLSIFFLFVFFLDACTSDDFTCVSQPGCVDQTYVCDGVPNCLDGSDEWSCRKCLHG